MARSGKSNRRAFPVKKLGKLAVLAVALMLTLALFGEEGLIRAFKLSRERDLQRQQVEALQDENRALRQEIELLRNDPRYLEGVARRELGMVREDELVYQFLPPGKAAVVQ